MSKKRYYIERLTALIAAIILLQTLYFKFTAHPDSVYIFSQMGIEPYGRIGLGIVELITALLLLLPRTSFIGGLLGSGIMAGAVFSHLFVLGIQVNNDNGTLFIMALITFLCCLTILFLKKNDLFLWLKKK